MAWRYAKIYILLTSLLLTPIIATICPDSCNCSTTRDGLHRATCSSLSDLYKYTLRQKHHNINILVLSHNNITKITHELDKLTEVVTLDLSTNGLRGLDKFLYSSKKLVHLNLAHNRIEKLSLLHVPSTVSSLDLTNNLLRNVPSDFSHLINLEHLELEGNPLDCSCDNIIARDRLLSSNIYIDNVKCTTPLHFKGRSWLELKTRDICKAPKMDYYDMMMGDQPMDAIKVGEESSALKPLSFVTNSGLEDGNVIHNHHKDDDDDSLQYMKVGAYISPAPSLEIEGSGDAESSTMSDVIEPHQEFVNIKTINQEEDTTSSNLFSKEEIIPAESIPHTTIDLQEGSGDLESGSGFGIDYEYTTELSTVSPSTVLEELNPTIVPKIVEDDQNSSIPEFPMPPTPTTYQGGADWHSKTDTQEITPKSATPQATRDTTVSERIRVTQASKVLGELPSSEEHTTHKTGTYVCIAMIVILLVGLIGFAIVKGQMRKRRDRRLLRQQKRDVEKASKEMVDMNKSLLGKPAVTDSTAEKKINGKYELVPTHEQHQKKGENGEVANGVKRNENNLPRTDSPRDTNQNKNSSVDNNLPNNNMSQETSFEFDPAGRNSRKDTNSLSSEDIFVPINDDDTTRINDNVESSQPLINGDPVVDSDYLSPSREYVPVYLPDMGRVRIKMSETPKPKTPVLVTRSRSNAGDIIITPSLDDNTRKSTT